MNKKLAILSLSMLLCTGFAASCGDKDDPSPIPEESMLIGYYTGTTVGNSIHFEGLSMPNVTDTVFVRAAVKNSLNFDVEYRSSYWGTATFENVSATKVNGVYELAEATGTISMPKRTPGAETVTYNEYPATLTASTIQLLPADSGRGAAYSFTIEANLGERAGIYKLTLTN